MRLIWLCLFIALSTNPAVAKQSWVFAYFKDNGEDGLHLAHSADGLAWTALNNDRSFLSPTVGEDRLMRDPSIVQGPDGQFHMVWTTGWHDRGIGVAHSDDLRTWSEQERIGVMDHEPGCKNCWAPEIFYDAATSQYLIFWASTIEGAFPETIGTCGGGLNHRMYYVTTRDFKTYSETKLFFDPGFAVIDSFLVKDDDQYVMVSKDETRYPEAKKKLFVAVADKAEGPYELLAEPFSPSWVEGPAVLKLDERWVVYFDEYTRHKYSAMQTTDFLSWLPAEPRLQHPDGMRHGTPIAIDQELADELLAHDSESSEATIRIDVDKPKCELDPYLYGLFYEDINYAGDGGLYAELIQNRSFEYFEFDKTPKGARCTMGPLHAWEAAEKDGAKVSMQVVDADPLNESNTHYLEVDIAGSGIGGVLNRGYDGIAIDKDAEYDFSVFVRSRDWQGDDKLAVRIEDQNGQSCGSRDLTGINETWSKLEGVIKADQSTDNGRLVITTQGTGTLHLDMVSLFPQETWKGRKNGLRKDLVQTLADLNPKTFRFPGGCIVHGDGLENAYNWKDTVGPVEARKPNFNLWGYHQTYGLGYFEYFLLCEDLDMTPLPVVPIGVGCGFRCTEFVPLDQLQSHIQDALDLIEFASGSEETEWGGLRASMGHPEPFAMEFLCLGNEEHDTPEMRTRFSLFARAVRESYPDIKIIGTSGLGPEIPIYNLMVKEDVFSSDEHYYEQPEWFIGNQNRFDDFDRTKPKIFIGEYGSWGNSLFNAVAEAAYLTGVERNGDIVNMTCYAPLFGRRDYCQWNPNMIYFDHRTVVRTPNYYVQQLFAQHKGDAYLENDIQVDDAPPGTISGAVGIGSWNTSIEIESVTVNGQTVQPDQWKTVGGNFEKRDGNYVQTDATATPAMSISSESYSGENLTFTVRARRLKGEEGFLLRVGADENGVGGYWWNVGGWHNSKHAIEKLAGDQASKLIEKSGSIKTGQWYDLTVELKSGMIRCRLDGKPVFEFEDRPAPLSVASAIDRSTNEVIVKLVNPRSNQVNARITLDGVDSVSTEGRLISISGDPSDENTFDHPDQVQPVTRQIEVAKDFEHTIPAMAVQFIRVKL